VSILKRLPTGIAILLLGGLAVMYVADPVITGRMVGLVFGRAASPEERVPGAPGPELPMASPGERSITGEAIDQAIAYGEETGSHALLVYHDGAIQLEHYYPGYDRDSRTSTQSMHKSVLALVVGIAIRDGFIASVNDAAARYLPEWAGDGRAKITIRQMLQQSSGIGFPTIGFNPVGGFFQLTLGGDITPVALNQPLEGEPGAKFEYNSINPQDLGLIV
jgi:CubicO group peptidase (beta-lactamase class C family)